MTKRLKSLARIEAVQRKLVALAELRLGRSEAACGEIIDDRAFLRDFIGRSDALGPRLAGAALRAGRALDERLARQEADRDACRGRRDLLKRRERAVVSMVREETGTARREAEDRVLDETLEAWLSRSQASFP